MTNKLFKKIMIFTVSGDTKKSMIYPGGFQDINNKDLSGIIEEGALTIKEDSICSYYRTIDTHRLDDNGSSRILVLFYDFLQTGSLVFRSLSGKLFLKKRVIMLLLLRGVKRPLNLSVIMKQI